MDYNFKFEQDIKKIKKLTDLEKKKDMIKQIAKSYKISQATVYRHLKKPVPSLRQVRSDAGKDKSPVTKKEIAVVAEIVKSGKPRKEAKKFIKNLSGHKLSKINKKIKDAEQEEDPETNFGSEAKRFITKLFELDLISSDSVMKFKFKGATIFVTKQEVADIGLILASAYNRSVNDDKQVAVDRFSMLKNELYHSVQEMHRLAKEKGSFKDLEACTRMYVRLDSSRAIELPNDFDIYFKCLQRKDPKITKEEAIDLVLEITSEHS